MNDNVRVYHVDEYCEGASHFSFSERKDVVLLDDYEKLREENERLKGENAKLNEEREKLKETIRQCDSFTLDFYKSLCDRLRKENAKLKCLVLHAMSEYFGYKTLFSNKKKLRTKYGQFANKFYEAYRKAKKELKEGK